jgi:RNA polymerase sigma factor (sigma-70 family)
MVSSVKYKVSDKDAVAVLKQYGDLVHKLVHSHLKSGFDYDELLTVGQEALLNAHNTYDPAIGCSFITHAYIKVNGDIGTYKIHHNRHTHHRKEVADWDSVWCTEGFTEATDNEMDIDKILTKLSNGVDFKNRNGVVMDGVRAAEILRKSWLEEKDQVTISKEYNISSERVRQI